MINLLYYLILIHVYLLVKLSILQIYLSLKIQYITLWIDVRIYILLTWKIQCAISILDFLWLISLLVNSLFECLDIRLQILILVLFQNGFWSRIIWRTILNLKTLLMSCLFVCKLIAVHLLLQVGFITLGVRRFFLGNILPFALLFNIYVFFDLIILLVWGLNGYLVCDKLDFSWDHACLILLFVHILLV